MGDVGFSGASGNASGCTGGGRSDTSGKGSVDDVVLVVLLGVAVSPLGVEVPVSEVRVLIVMMKIWARKINYCLLVEGIKVLPLSGNFFLTKE